MRIKYIDALRGFTMFLVVFWHVYAFGFGEKYSILTEIFGMFRMPMFFFISGYIGYKSIDKFNELNLCKYIKHKAFVQLVPTIIVYTFYMYCIGSSPMIFFQKGFESYWFTLVLFELYIFFYLTSYIYNKTGGNRLQDISYLIVILIFWAVALFLGKMGPALPKVFHVLNITSFFSYLPFFCFGLLLRKYEDKLLPIITHNYTLALSFSIFAIGFLLKETLFTKEDYLIIYYILTTVLLRYAGLIFVFGVFHHSADFFNKEGRISEIMQYVGRRTLDIYLLHYFFISDLSRFKSILSNGENEFIIGELLIIGTISVLIISVCLLISFCLRKSSVLEKYLFGVIKK